MHVANCESLLLLISCEMNADQSLFVVDLNERHSDSASLVWSMGGAYRPQHPIYDLHEFKKL